MEIENIQSLGKAKINGSPDSVVTGTPNFQDENASQFINNLLDDKLYPTSLLTKKFRNLFVTIPHTDISYNILHQDIVDKFKTKFVITCEELHEDNDTHIHQLVIFEGQQQLKKYHNHLASYNLRVKGAVEYQTPQNIPKVINYIKKDDKYIIHGDIEEQMKKSGKAGAPKGNVNNKSYQEQKDDIYTELVKCLDDNTMTKEEAIKYLKQYDAREFIRNNDKIMKYIDEHFTPKYEEWDIPELKAEEIKLKPWQQELWDILNTRPKARQIIWIKGDYGIGKSFMLNYIEQNYKYGVYNAGQSVSYDNVVYGYKQQGVIAWDLPRNFDWETLKTPFCNIVEKFSDVGQYLTSKKYTGNKVRVKGHTIVFSNQSVPEELIHRDIKIIKTNYALTKDGRVVVQLGNTYKYYNNIEEFKLYHDSEEELC